MGVMQVSYFTMIRSRTSSRLTKTPKSETQPTQHKRMRRGEMKHLDLELPGGRPG